MCLHRKSNHCAAVQINLLHKPHTMRLVPFFAWYQFGPDPILTSGLHKVPALEGSVYTSPSPSRKTQPQQSNKEHYGNALYAVCMGGGSRFIPPAGSLMCLDVTLYHGLLSAAAPSPRERPGCTGLSLADVHAEIYWGGRRYDLARVFSPQIETTIW